MNNQAVTIEEDEIDLKELFNILKQKYKQILFVSFIVSFIVLVVVIFKPNVYTSSTKLTSIESSSNSPLSSLGGLGGLASFAGINLSGSSLDNFDYLQTIIKNKQFNYHIINKYNLIQKLNTKQNYIYPLGITFPRNFGNKILDNIEKNRYETYKKLLKIINLSKDIKSNIITLSATLEDKNLTKSLVNVYLYESIKVLKTQDLKELDKQIKYYKIQIAQTSNVELKTTISNILSSLIQKKVLSDSSEFYLFKQLIAPQVPNNMEKVKPKRALMIIVSFITTLILMSMIVLLLSYLKKEDEV